MSPRHMLIVEDDPSSRKALSRRYAARGWEVVTAATVADALAALDSGPPPDWLLLDLMLPDGDGEDVLRRVRADGLPTRVVVATGVGDRYRLRAVVALGPDAVMRKPLDPAALDRHCEGPGPGGVPSPDNAPGPRALFAMLS
jgi:two-component system, OmpR family, response regulator